MDAEFNDSVLPMVQSAFSLLGANSNTMPRFIGYPALTGLTQNGLIRAGVDMIADEMTRKWIDVTTTGKALEDGEQNPVIAGLKEDMERFGTRMLFHNACEMVSYYGGCLAYIDTGEEDPVALATPLYLDESAFPRGSLRGFRLIEPFNVSPGMYNTNNPLAADYFRPRLWYVLGREVHASRFLYFSAAHPPTILLPAYNFFGIPLAQTVCDVVHHFTECREAEMRLLKKFSMTVFKTDMSDLMNGLDDVNIRARAKYFVQNQDNDGMMMIDKEEDIIKIETPLSGVTDIVRQAMEMVAAYFGEPTVKLWGISPGGFNATGESDMRNHYDRVAANQEKMFRSPLNLVLRVLQHNRNGAVDGSITANFIPVGDDDESKRANVNKLKADIASVYLQSGVLAPEEVRQMLVDDEQSGYTTIDPEAVPEDDADMGGMEGMEEMPEQPNPQTNGDPPASDVGGRGTMTEDGAPLGNKNAAGPHESRGTKGKELKRQLRRIMGESKRLIGTDRIPNLEKRIVESAVRENYSRFKDRVDELCGFCYANSYYLIRNESIESCRPIFRVPIEKNEERIKRLERVFGDERL